MRKVCYEMIYETIEEAIGAAKVMSAVLESVVKITACKGGYELFGTGDFVMEIIE